MRILPLVAAAAVAAFAVPAAGAPVPAKAGVSSQVRISIGDRHHHRRAHWKTVCTTKWRHHHRVRVCRKVRVWR